MASPGDPAVGCMDPVNMSPGLVTRLYLLKHHLLAKAPADQVTRVVEDLCGLHAQVPQTPYLSLWTRVKDFENVWLDQALYDDRSLVKTWLMRGTLHLVPSRDLPVYNQALRTMWFEHHGRFMRAPEWPPADERRRIIYPAIVTALAHAPLTRKDLSSQVRAKLRNRALPYDRLFSGWGGILKETGYAGLTVHARPCGRESCFAQLGQWLPEVHLDRVSEEAAQTQLLLKYLRGYGPATQQDFMLWSGLAAGPARRAIAGASASVTQVTVDGSKAGFLLLKEDLRTLAAIDLDEPAPLRLLPKFDSMLLGHKDRGRIISAAHKSRVFTPRIGDVSATVLVNGRIVGTWKHKRTKTALTVVLEPFEKLRDPEVKEAEREATAMSQYWGFAGLKFLVTR
jgi:uncharacterized protein YcaQ